MSSAPISEQETRTASSPEKPHASDPGPETPSGFGFRKWLVLLIIVLVVGAAVWKIRKNTEEQASQDKKMSAMLDRPSPVQTVDVQQKTMPIYLTELGTVTAYYTVTVKSRVDGQLLRVTVREGEKVRKGQLLAEIDPAPYQAALAQAQGSLARDQAQHANDEAQSNRYRALQQAGVVSQESAQAQVAAAGQSSGAILADQAAIQAAKVNVDYTRITSPIDGIVGLRQVDPGNIVHAADTTGLIVVTQLQPIAVIFTLPEDHLPDVLDLMRKGKSLTVEAYDRSGSTHLATGKVLTVDNQIDTTTGTVKVKAVFDNKDGALFPNQFVNIRLVLEERPNAIVVPAAAILTGSAGNFVYVVKPGDPPADLQTVRPEGLKNSSKSKETANALAADASKNQPHFYVEARTVKVDLTEGNQVILSKGLAAGETIVIDGQEKLRNGSRVIPRKATNPNGPKASVNPNRANSGVNAASPHDATAKSPSGGQQK
ncbi:MAG: efflux RND transporter periplasmic adaptor subunit [Edaphobacter sp.]|uniref:efflux RND transporter periplasmic adaptor subunit n=1 Tax=Edaphobacter sp. TaxID=1934404 RepID=UPI0023937326|nr:efflux RND transporter periplasmic adaptor subunit [Edaphobacter sp.]MDE1176522.1 efflux RND transporter periplasmic adaptor subunit [Edaphobacter sp.]